MIEPLTGLLAQFDVQLRLVAGFEHSRSAGTFGSSVCAQACADRIVETIEISLAACYGILHEAAHIIEEEYCDEIPVMRRQQALCGLLPEPWRHRGYEFHTSYVSTGL